MVISNSVIYYTAFSTVSTLCWYELYKKFRRRFCWEEEFTSRAVAAIHAIIVVILAFFCLKYGPNPLEQPGEVNTKLQIITMLVSIGYFIYDFGWCLKYQPEPKIMLYHHLASIIAMYYILLHGSSGCEAIGGLGSLELTNPLLQTRWFLRTLGYMDTIYFKIVEVTFFVLFLVVRLGYGTQLLLAVLGSEKSALPVKICTILLYIISIAFIYAIGRLIVRRIIRGPSSPDGEEEEDVKLS